MSGVSKPRFNKSRPGKIHVGKPFDGLKLPTKHVIVARRGWGDAYEKVTTVRISYEDAKAAAQEYIDEGWDVVDILERRA